MYSEDHSSNRQPSSANPSSAPSAAPSANGQAAAPDRLHCCSRCGTDFKRSESKNMPFCSRRCQQIDLGMWLNESYGFPHEGQDAANDYDPEE